MDAYQAKMSEQEKLTDLLSTQKFMAATYNAYCCESATTSVRSSLCSILQDELRIQEEIFGEMNTRGYYPLQTAEETKINAEKQKFAQKANV